MNINYNDLPDDLDFAVNKGSVLQECQKKNNGPRKHYRVRLESFELITHSHSKESVVLDLSKVRSVKAVTTPLFGNGTEQDSFTIMYDTTFPMKRMTFKVVGDFQHQWINALSFLVKHQDEIPYSVMVSRYLWRNFYGSINSSLSFSSYTTNWLCCFHYNIKEKFNFNRSSSADMSKKSLTTSSTAQANGIGTSTGTPLSISNLLHNIKSRSSKADKSHSNYIYHGPVKEVPSSEPLVTKNLSDLVHRTPMILSHLPTVSTYSSSSSEQETILTIEIPTKNLRIWFEHEGIKMPDSSIRGFIHNHDDSKVFGTLKKLYDGVSCNPSADLKDADFGKQSYEPVSVEEFTEFFLRQEKRGSASPSEEKLKSDAKCIYENLLMWARCINGQNDIDLPQLPKIEFANYLFSETNSIVRPEMKDVHQNMCKPLSHYWINSSHNTYLVGNQYSSDASPESYATALMYGCRCVELDCWNGDSEPVITHGHSFCGKTKFRNVIYAIKEYAFALTDFPLVLSLEQHCDIGQQRIMADILTKTFGDQLLVTPINQDESQLPSPIELKGKVVLKHKKLKLVKGQIVQDDSDDKDDYVGSKLTGILYLKGPDMEWKPYFSILNNCEGKLLYMPDTSSTTNAMPESTERRGTLPTDAVVMPSKIHAALADLYKGPTMSIEGLGPDLIDQKWYHGDISSEEANAWIEHYSFIGDGVFLVRRSQQHPGHAVIVYSHDKGVRQLLVEYVIGDRTGYVIRQKSNRNQVVYTSMADLLDDAKANNRIVNHHKQYVRLGEPAPQRHEIQPWYHPSMQRSEAETLLLRANVRGAFLIRAKHLDINENQSDASSTSNSQNQYVLSYVNVPNEIKHSVIIADSFNYAIYDKEFFGLCDLVDYYHTGAGKVPLLYPVNKDTVLTIQKAIEEENNRKPGEDEDYDLPMKNLLSNLTNAVRDIAAEKREKEERDRMNMLSIDLNDSKFKMQVVEKPQGGKMGVIMVSTSLARKHFGFKEPAEMDKWVNVLKEFSKDARERNRENAKIEKSGRVAQELSDLVVYCQTAGYKGPECAEKYSARQMSSFSETKMEGIAGAPLEPDSDLNAAETIAKYLKFHIGRIYPKGLRLDSSNYDPFFFWSLGAQMVALNVQTHDRAHQLNQGRFMLNGGCGWIERVGGPLEQNPADSAREIHLELLVGRHLPRVQHACVEVELISEPWNEWAKPIQVYRVATRGALCAVPVDKLKMVFVVNNPQTSMFRITYVSKHQQMRTGSAPGSCIDDIADVIGHFTVSVNAIRTGIRSVPLKGRDGCHMPLATLLMSVWRSRHVSSSSINGRGRYLSNMSLTSSESEDAIKRQRNLDTNVMKNVIERVLASKSRAHNVTGNMQANGSLSDLSEI